MLTGHVCILWYRGDSVVQGFACVDYRRLNSVTVKDAFPQPSIDCLSCLSGANGSSTLGIAFPYQQVALNRLPCIYVYIPVFGTNIDCKTVRVFAYSSTREQSNKRSGTRLKTESETGDTTLSRASHA